MQSYQRKTAEFMIELYLLLPSRLIVAALAFCAELTLVRILSLVARHTHP